VALSAKQRAALEDAARREGVDARELVAEAERLSGGGDSDGETAAGRPVAERLLIGFLPFIKVRELRSIWLGLDERIPDDELTCGEYSLRHGGQPAAKPEDSE